MTEEQIELGRRAVACKGWRWMPGMLARDARWILHRIQDDGSALDLSDDILERGWGYSTKTLRPIFDDPATLGCLLALVREAWNDKAMTCARVDVLDTYIAPLPGGYPYGVVGMDRRRIFKRYFGSEAEALVAALEAAP
jgi:hypothetical protein